MSEQATIESRKLPKVAFQVVRIEEKNQKEVVVKKGVAKTDGRFLVVRKKLDFTQGIPGMYDLDPSVPLEDIKVGRKTIKGFRFLEGVSEPLVKGSHTAKFSEFVEKVMMGSYVEQAVTVATALPTFKISRDLAIAMIVTAFMAGFFGLGLNSIFHFVPTTVVHWLPGPVK